MQEGGEGPGRKRGRVKDSAEKWQAWAHDVAPSVRNRHAQREQMLAPSFTSSAERASVVGFLLA
eukprot:8740286-Prorocentrum_lima.AAC.1